MTNLQNAPRIGTNALMVALLLLSGAVVHAASPDLAVSITDGLTTINPGASMLYTVTVTNNGNATASGAALSTNIPSPATFGSSTSGGTVQNGKVVFPSFTLNAGANKTFQFILNIPNPLPANPPATVAVTATAVLAADTNSANNSATDTDTLNNFVPFGDLAIEITDGLTEISAGASMLYTMTVSNLGNITMTNTLVKATIPANTTFVSAANSGFVQNGFVVYPLFSIAPGEVVTRQFTLSLNNPLPTPAPTFLTVNAYVDSPDGECAPANNEAADCDTIKVVVPCPDVCILKTAPNIDCKVRGGQFTYTLTISTANSVAVTGVVVTDPLPAGLTYVSSSNGGTFANGTVTFPAFALAGNSSTTRTITVQVNANLGANVTSITNTAYVTDDGWNGADSNTTNNVSSFTNCIQNNPDVSIVKTATVNDCKIRGTQFSYTLTISTLNAVAVTGVVVTDPIPAGLTYVSSSNGGTFANGTVTFPAFSLAGNSSATRTITVLVNANLAANVSSITNTAYVTDDGTNGADSNTSNNVSSYVTCIQGAPDVAIVKTAPNDCKPRGTQFTYTLTISTLNAVAVTGVVVTDPLPAGLTYITSSNGGTFANGTVTFPAFALAGNSNVTRSITVLVNANLGANVSSITNTAYVTDDGTHGADTNTNNNVSPFIICVQGTPDVAIVKTTIPNDCKIRGTQFSYTLTISTLNAVAVTGVVVTDPLPAGLTYVTSSNGGTFANGTVTFPAFALAGNSSVIRTITVLVNANLAANVNSISNTAYVTDDGTNGADSNTTNNSSNHLLCIQGAPDVAIVKTAPNDCKPRGSQFTYTLTISTLNAVAVTGVVVTDPIPAGLTYVSASNGGTFANGTVTFPAFALAGNSNVTRTITVLVNANLAANVISITNTAYVTDDGTHGADVDTTNNVSPFAVCIQGGPDVAIVKTAPDNCKARGSQFTYTLTVSTLNSVAVTGVVITDPIPAGLTYVSSSNGGTFANGIVTFPAFALAGNSSTTRFITVQVNANLAANVTSITNTASVTDDGTHGADTNTNNNVSPKLVCIQGLLDLNVAITDDIVDCVSAGKNIVFTVTACNIGGSTATGVVVKATLPANTTLVSATDGGTLFNGVITYPTIGSLNPLACVTRYFTVTVNTPLAAGVVQVTSTATVTDDGQNGADANPANNAAIDNVPVCQPTVDLKITITDDVEDCVKPTGLVEFTLTACNAGATVATGVVITDVIQANTQYVSSSNGGVFANGVVTFPTIPVLNPGECVIRIVTVKLLGAPGAVAANNTASVTDDKANGVEATPADNVANDAAPICPKPDLEITQNSSPVCFAPGAQITYTLLVKNLVINDVSGVVVTDTIPANTTFVSASNGGTFANGVVTFPAFDLPANVTALRTVTVAVNAVIPANVTLTNVASAKDDGSFGADTNAANNSATRTDCTTPPCVEPSIISGPSATPVPITAGTLETMSIVVSDNGSGKPITVTWDFGDGTPFGTGETVTHTYAAAGSYSIKVTVANACGAVGASLQAATGSKPNPFECNLLRAPVNLKKTNSDSLTFVAQLPTKPGFNPAGQKIALNFSNFSFSATLDKKGRYKDARHAITVKKFGTDSSLVSVKVTKENLKNPLTPGVSSSASTATLPGQRYLISIGSENFGQNLDINYTGSGEKGMIFR